MVGWGMRLRLGAHKRAHARLVKRHLGWRQRTQCTYLIPKIPNCLEDKCNLIQIIELIEATYLGEVHCVLLVDKPDSISMSYHYETIFTDNSWKCSPFSISSVFIILHNYIYLWLPPLCLLIFILTPVLILFDLIRGFLPSGAFNFLKYWPGIILFII